MQAAREKRKNSNEKKCPLKDFNPQLACKVNFAKHCATANVLIGGNRVLQSDFPSYFGRSLWLAWLKLCDRA